MPSRDEHQEKYEHNKDFYQNGFNNSKAKYNDWEIVILFYCSVHIIEAVLKQKFDEHSHGHKERNEFIYDHKDVFSDVSIEYCQLQSLAHTARYQENYKIKPRDVSNAHTYLDCIEEWYKNAI